MPNDFQELLLDRRIDFVFKRIFGDPDHPAPLIDLLNAIFEAVAQPPITALTVLNPSLEPDCEGDKTAILDIRAKTAEGYVVNIEMQVVNQGDYLHRTLYYWAELYGESLHAGDSYSTLSRTITINLLNFKLFQRERMISLYHLQDSQDHHVLTDLMQICFIELTKPSHLQLPSHLQQWLKFFIIEDKQELQHLSQQNPAIGEAFKMLNYISQDPQERQRYLSRKIALMDQQALQQWADEARRKQELAEQKLELVEQKLELAERKVELAQAAVLRRQLSKRFGPLPAWVEDQLCNALTDQLDIWAEKILDAQSLEAVFR